MTHKDKKELEQILSGFESALNDFDSSTNPAELEIIIERIATMDKGLASFEILEA
jgi:hypothetical protein